MDATQARTASPLPEVPQPPLGKAEEWRSVEGWPYEVSDQGRVRRVGKTVSLKRPYVDDSGYYAVGLYGAGNSRTKRIHVLMMCAFRGPRPEGRQINHIDGNKLNNWLSNLEWATASENTRHSFRLGLQSTQGEKNGRAKLTNAVVLEMRRVRVETGKTYKEIGTMFGMSGGSAWNVISGTKWGHV